MRACLLVLWLSAVSCSRCAIIQMSGSAQPLSVASRFGRRGGARVVTAEEEEGANVVEASTTFGTVKTLNSLNLQQFRCHSITEDAAPTVDPFQMTTTEVSQLNELVCSEVTGEEEVLTAAAQHYFGGGDTREGKRVRPVIVGLMGKATLLATPDAAPQPAAPQGAVVSTKGAPPAEAAAEKAAKAAEEEEATAVALAKHQRLAAITEMIHTASLVHDDVLDAADTRRGGSAVHRLYSTKAAVLSGDFLLARASIALAKLEMPTVVQEMAKSLEALVQGEIMQLQSTAEERRSLEYYLTKSYCKTASLMAFSCKSAALLSGHSRESEVCVAAEKFGYHFGLAFQVIDDLLDFTGTSETLGKPGLQDIALGLSTAPVLYAIDEQPDLVPLVERKFGQPGDVERACELVMASTGLQRTKELATFHAQAAVDACCSLPPSDERDGLIQLCHVVLSRSS